MQAQQAALEKEIAQAAQASADEARRLEADQVSSQDHTASGVGSTTQTLIRRLSSRS